MPSDRHFPDSLSDGEILTAEDLVALGFSVREIRRRTNATEYRTSDGTPYWLRSELEEWLGGHDR
jgi:hypothetical protein